MFFGYCFFMLGANNFFRLVHVEQDMSIRLGKIKNTDSPKFKGVVSQPNGHWGAQIYKNHQRIWLGTFKTEIEAAMAYDSASIKIRTVDNQRNLPWSCVTKYEPMFQSKYSADKILSMIKDGYYSSKFSDFLRTQNEAQGLGPSSNQDYSGYSCKLLFQKELTPSDVSKLNRLVVPKKYAVKYFPQIANAKEDDKEGGKMDEVHLVFKDRMNRQWKFRYCYWQSSQSYVFTRGWNRFVKENKLNANDTIAFYVCESRKMKRGKERESFWLIDIGCSGETTDVRVMEEIGENANPQIDLSLRLGQKIVKEEEDKLVEDQVSTRCEANEPLKRGRTFEVTDPYKATSFKLFGVEINEIGRT